METVIVIGVVCGIGFLAVRFLRARAARGSARAAAAEKKQKAARASARSVEESIRGRR